MMNVHGMGSLSSPIVISDDEDEACVELELEQRLSSPREGMELDFDVDIQNSYTWGGSVAQHNLYHDEQRMDDYLRVVAPNGRMLVHGTLPISLFKRSDICILLRNKWRYRNWPKA